MLLKDFMTQNSMSCFTISGLYNFSVSKIFDCGQCFRFNLVENSKHEVEYSGVAFGRFVSFAQDGDTLYIYNSTEEDFENIWKHYLSLDIDYLLFVQSFLTLVIAYKNVHLKIVTLFFHNIHHILYLSCYIYFISANIHFFIENSKFF